MTNKEKIEIERKRTPENINKILLFRDGTSPWYSAFEWSAYLLEFYPSGLQDKERLCPMHKTQKEIDGSIIKVGFQLSSLKKYLPNVQVNNVEENLIEIEIELYDGLSYNNYIEKLDTWKSNVKIKDKNNENVDKKEATSKPNSLFVKPCTFLHILKHIIVFDTHGKTENELREFIFQIKEMCASLIC